MSSGAELRVVLVGDDPEQQEAFNRDMRRRDDQADLNSRIKDPEDSQPQDSSTAQEAPVSLLPPGQARAEQAELRLVSSIDELIEALNKLTEPLDEQQPASAPKQQPGETPVATPQPAGDSFFDQLGERLNKILDRAGSIYSESSFGSSPVGKRLQRTGRMARQAAGGVIRTARRSKTLNRLATKLPKFRSARLPRPAAIPPGAASAAGEATAATAGARAASGAAAAAGSQAAGAAGAGAGAGAAGAGAGVAAVAVPLAAVAVAAVGTTVALQQMISAVHNAAGELEDMSPELAAVRSQFEVMREMARLDRAQRVGAGAAQIEAARGRLGESMYELQTRMLETIVRFAPLFEAIIDTLNAGVRGVDAAGAQVQVLLEEIKDFFGDQNPQNNADAQARADKANAALAQAIRAILTSDEPTDHGMDPWISEMFTIQAPQGRGRPAPPPPKLGANP